MIRLHLQINYQMYMLITNPDNGIIESEEMT